MRRLRAASAGSLSFSTRYAMASAAAADVVRVRVVLRLARAVVRVADDVVRPEVVARERHAVSAGEPHAQHPVEAPLRFLDRAGRRAPGSSPRDAALGEREHRVRRFAGIDQALRQIAGVVPAAAHRDSLVAERREPVEMIDAVRARHVEPAALAVEEVERLPDACFSRRRRQCGKGAWSRAGANHVAARRCSLRRSPSAEMCRAACAPLITGFSSTTSASAVVVHAQRV